METGKGKFLALDSSTMMITIEIKIIRIARWAEVDVNDISKHVQKIFSYVLQYIFFLHNLIPWRRISPNRNDS